MRRLALIACLVLVACGDDGVHHLPDGPTQHDGSVAGPDASPAGDITVKTLSHCCDVAPLTPIAGVPIVVVQPDGTLGTGGVTGADGTLALHGVLPGAAITAAYPEDTNNDAFIDTFMAVKPGDHLTFGGESYSFSTNGTAGTMTINVPALANAASYEAATLCGRASSTTTAISVPQAATCQTATSPVALFAYDAGNYVIGSSYTASTSFANDAVFAAPAWITNTQSNFTATINGLLGDVTSVYLGGEGFSSTGQYGNGGYATIATGSASITTTLAAAMPKLFGYANMYRNNLGEQDDYRAAAASATSITLTASPTLPWIGQVTVNAAVGKALWLQTDGTYDAADVSLDWSRYDSTADTYHYFNWNVVAPPGISEIDFGTPPTTLAAYLPTSSDSLGTSVALFDLSSAANYDAIRALPEAVSFDPVSYFITGTEPSVDISFDNGGGQGTASSPGRRAHRRRH